MNLAQTRIERCVGDELAGAHVIGMALVRPRRKDELRPDTPDEVDELQLLLTASAQAAVAEIELLAEPDAEDAGGGARFTLADLRCSTRTHFAVRQFEHPRGDAAGRGFRDRPA